MGERRCEVCGKRERPHGEQLELPGLEVEREPLGPYRCGAHEGFFRLAWAGQSERWAKLVNERPLPGHKRGVKFLADLEWFGTGSPQTVKIEVGPTAGRRIQARFDAVALVRRRREEERRRRRAGDSARS